MKINVDLKVSEINFDADYWELYSSKNGSNMCADRLNKRLEKLVNSGLDPSKVISEMFKYMNEDFNRKYGASDSEPEYTLVDIVNKIYGTEFSRWDF